MVLITVKSCSGKPYLKVAPCDELILKISKLKKKVIVIGAGFSSLAASCYLAKAGYQVQVLEKNKESGGRARQLKKDGFTFDIGPTFYWMPDVFERFFDDFGNKLPLFSLLAFTDSNLDGDPGDFGTYSIGVPGGTFPDIGTTWPFASRVGAGTPFEAYFKEDGSVGLKVIPEPSTFVLLGAGLLGLGVIYRKRNKE